MNMGKDFLSVADVAAHDVAPLVAMAEEIKRGAATRPLAGKIIALLLRSRRSGRGQLRSGHSAAWRGLRLPEQGRCGLGVREPSPTLRAVLDGGWTVWSPAYPATKALRCCPPTCACRGERAVGLGAPVPGHIRPANHQGAQDRLGGAAGGLRGRRQQRGCEPLAGLRVRWSGPRAGPRRRAIGYRAPSGGWPASARR